MEKGANKTKVSSQVLKEASKNSINQEIQELLNHQYREKLLNSPSNMHVGLGYD